MQWTAEDINYLLENANELTAKEIGKHLKRTENAVLCMANRHKIAMRDKVPTLLTANQLMRALNMGSGKLKFFSTVKSRMLVRELYDIEQVVKVIEKTPELDLYAYVEGSLGGFETEEMLKQIKESKRRKEERLKLIASVLDLYSKGIPQKEIATIEKVSVTQVNSIIARHGEHLKKSIYHKWTFKEEQELLNCTDYEAFAKKIGVTKNVALRKLKHIQAREDN